MRDFCDGGAFLLELFYEYLAFTRDLSFVEEKCCWLNSDEQDTVLEHIVKCVEITEVVIIAVIIAYIMIKNA